MKILKRILIVLLCIVLLLALIGFLLPKTSHVETSTVINAPVSVVYDQFNELKNWEKWSPWVKMDPGVKLSYSEPSTGENAYYEWKGEKTGEGRMTILSSTVNESTNFLLDFKDQGKAASAFKVEPAGDNSTKVTWSFDSEPTSNPFSRVMMSAMKGMLKGQFEDGLKNMKAVAEKAPAPAAQSDVKVEETTVNAMTYLAVGDSGDMKTIGPKLGSAFGKIQSEMEKQKIKQSGPPFAIYYSDSQTAWKFDACIPGDKAGKSSGDVKSGTLKAGKAVVAHYFGAYEGSGGAHQAIHSYIDSKQLKINGAPWEVYVTDPMNEKDTAKWQTDIYYPVE